MAGTEEGLSLHEQVLNAAFSSSSFFFLLSQACCLLQHKNCLKGSISIPPRMVSTNVKAFLLSPDRDITLSHGEKVSNLPPFLPLPWGW